MEINEKKKKKFDAVGWKSYCSRLYCGAGRWQALGARDWADCAQQALGERDWADCAQQALGERACLTCQARAAGGRERAWRAGRVGAQGVLGRAGHAGARRASVLGRAGRQAHGRLRARGRARQLGAGAGARQGAGRAAGRSARGRQGAGRASGRRWVRGARAAWAPGLALGSALGTLGPFSIRFDSLFFPSHQMNTVHCKINFFRKKKIYLLNSNKIK